MKFNQNFDGLEEYRNECLYEMMHCTWIEKWLETNEVLKTILFPVALVYGPIYALTIYAKRYKEAINKLKEDNNK